MEGKFTIGADPEMFIRHREQKKVLSAIPFVKGTKEEPEKLPNGGTIQHDNVAIEFAIEPAGTKAEFINNIANGLQDVKNYLPKHVDIDIIPATIFNKHELEDPKAQEFGCDPDYNAWTGEKNKPPKNAAKGLLRSCGGHVHVGYVSGSGNHFLLHKIGKMLTVKMMDIFHGVIFTVLDADDRANMRRKLYGKVGCYRPTEYGIEYRTLSNCWIKSPQMTKLVYHLTDDVLRLMRKEGEAIKLLKKVKENDLKNIIENGKVEDAMKFIREKLLQRMSTESKALFDICFFEAMDCDFEKLWRLT
jgi:hypothetical protein